MLSETGDRFEAVDQALNDVGGEMIVVIQLHQVGIPGCLEEFVHPGSLLKTVPHIPEVGV
jgi:hypothetical protein